MGAKRVEEYGVAAAAWIRPLLSLALVLLALVMGIKVVMLPSDTVSFDMSAFLAMVVSIAAVALSFWLNNETMKIITEFRERAISLLERTEKNAEIRNQNLEEYAKKTYECVSNATNLYRQKSASSADENIMRSLEDALETSSSALNYIHKSKASPPTNAFESFLYNTGSESLNEDLR